MLVTLTPLHHDIITVCMVAVLALVVVALVIRKAIVNKKAVPAPVPQEPVVVQPKEAPGAAGQLKLHNVDPKTAAMLMAIVADKLQKPINELRFISIKEVE